jgi:hypothetical protein
MEDGAFIAGWDRTRPKARNDYYVQLNSGPAEADEFITWSLCTNSGADPRRNAWSGIHTRLSAEMISRGKRIDGVVIWDMICGTLGRPCPKLRAHEGVVQRTSFGPFDTPPPCIYVFPAEIPSRARPRATARTLIEVELLSAFHKAFGGRDEEVNYVDFEVADRGGRPIPAHGNLPRWRCAAHIRNDSDPACLIKARSSGEIRMP